MSVAAGILPSLRASRLLGLTAFDEALEATPRRSWCLAAINLVLQMRHVAQPKLSFVLGFAQWTTLLVLATDRGLRETLARLEAFNEAHLPVDERRLRRFSRMATFWNLFVSVAFALGCGPRDEEPILGFASTFGRFAGFSVSCGQVAVWFYLAGLWYEAVNALARESSSRDAVRLVGEADSLIKDFNDAVAHVYSLFLLLAFASTLFECVYSPVYRLLRPDVDTWETVAVVLYVSHLITQLCVLVATASASAEKAREVGTILQERFVDVEDSSLGEEVEIVSLQVLHRKLVFTACGFFDIDFSLASSMAAAVAAYVIVAMQLRESVDDCSHRNSTLLPPPR